MEKCIICIEETNDYITCKNNHLMCKICFEGLIKNNIENSIIDNIKCLECDYIFSDTILKYLPDELFLLYQEKKINYAKINAKLEEQKNNNKDLRIQIENMFCPKCPKCNQVFFDNNACRAVTCNICNINFCAFCCEFNSNNNDLVHKHVIKCPINTTKQVFVNTQIYEKDRDLYIRLKIVNFLRHLKPEELEIAKTFDIIKNNNIIPLLNEQIPFNNSNIIISPDGIKRIFNPKTGRWVLTNGKIGKTLLTIEQQLTNKITDKITENKQIIEEKNKNKNYCILC